LYLYFSILSVGVIFQWNFFSVAFVVCVLLLFIYNIVNKYRWIRHNTYCFFNLQWKITHTDKGSRQDGKFWLGDMSQYSQNFEIFRPENGPKFANF
jgi:hypothetical protein